MKKNDITPELAKQLGDRLKIDWNKIPLDQFVDGMKVELEHGKVNPKTNITGDNGIKTAKVALAHLLEDPHYYRSLKKMEESFKKGEHLTDQQKAHIKNMYKTNPSKWSVRTLAKHLGKGKSQVASVVEGLPSSSKTDEQRKKKQSDHAHFLGKKLPKHVREAAHQGRNLQIEKRPQSTMEVPVSRGLRAMGIAFKSQIDLGKFFKLDDPEVGIADYYIPSKKTFVQADGPRHSLKNVAARVAKQDRLIRSRGYKVVHVKPGDLAHLKAILSNI